MCLYRKIRKQDFRSERWNIRAMIRLSLNEYLAMG